MNRRNLILLAVAALIIVGAFLIFNKWFSNEPKLTVILRCNGKISGKLSVAKILPNGETEKPETFEAANVCQAGNFSVANYRQSENLKTTLITENSKETQVISVYDEDIQSDQSGFYTILKLSDTAPFLLKDKL